MKEIRNLLTEHYPHVYQYLPEPEIELPKVPKEWIGNVCATVLEEKFSKWVKTQTENRHEKVAVSNNLHIEMDP